ncbi:conjugal transfer protein TrbI, partial [Rhizobium leguminosarum]
AQGSGDASKSAAAGLDANSKWLFATQSAEVKPAAAIIAQQAKGLYWLAPGTAISAVLLNAVDTKLPGQLVARVTQNIYDSRYGRYLVIPAGSTLQGKYNSSVQEGQDRVLMVFDTLVTPAGGMVPLGNMSAADALGRAGLEGD